MNHDDDDRTDTHDLPIVRDFDKVCFEYGDRDAISVKGSDPVSYFEIQEHSKGLAQQLRFRFARPDYILVDCGESPAAEAVATLACMRLQRPFVPVSSRDQHRPGRMNAVVDLLLQQGKIYKTNSFSDKPSIVAVVVCENDRDPMLSVFQTAGIHRILYLCSNGSLRESLSVPESLGVLRHKNDDMYVMFTSGTSSATPKAVVGSHASTHARLRWFLNTFASSPRIGRKTKLTFVDGVNELWGGLLDPTNLLVAVPPRELGARGVLGLLQDTECTQVLLLPSQANQLLLATSSDAAAAVFFLKRVIVSGEVCSTTLLEGFRSKYPATQLINLYGQTETTGDCLCAVLTDLGEASIRNNVVAVGKPITDGLSISLLETHSNQRTAPKELVIKGSQLSNGYLGSSSNDDTFDTFIPGDVGFCHNGIWYVQGRIDDVRKVNGILTSSSEIEAAFCKTYGISDDVVAIFTDNHQASLLSTNHEAVQNFSRLHMHQHQGIPLNLIPKKVVYVPCIPRKASGAKKIDSDACRELLDNLDCFIDETKSDNSEQPKRKSDEPKVSSIIATVLCMKECDLDTNMSFLELGGDSASSITLLYRLKQEIPELPDLNATDILWSESVQELEQMITGKSKRTKRDTNHTGSSDFQKFVAQDALQVHSNKHRSVPLLACVDSTPLVEGDSVITACQGGVILRFNSTDGTVEASKHYPGWMFQADLLVFADTLLVCGYSGSNKGIVICLTAKKLEENWKTEVDGSVKSRPVIIDNELWILADSKLVCLGVANGQALKNKEFQLPRVPCVSNPLLITTNARKAIAFASSDWEGGIVVFDPTMLTSKIHVDCEIGPVHKNMVLTGSGREILICDSYGSLHVLTISTMTLSASIQLAYYPLSAPIMIDDGTIIVGAYNGKLHCVTYGEDDSCLNIKWECDCHSSIYTRPLNLQDESSIVVCTTAGNILKVPTTTRQIECLYNVPAEIWSSPVHIGTTNLLAIGARDSQCHVVPVGT